jgi:hypothetical protein
LQSINYQNGAKDIFSDPVREENRYLPNNQNDGVQRYNDKAILSIDDALNSYKKLRNTAWIGGAVLAGVAIGCFIDASHRNGENEAQSNTYGFLSLGGAVLWTSCFLIVAHNKKNNAQILQSSTIFQHDLKFDDGSSLSFRADILRDQMFGNKTVGMGVCYTF